MSETWKRWEGRTVDGRFLLQSYLGGSDHSAVFVTQLSGGDSKTAAIKLIAADPADAEKQLLRWKTAQKLEHLNLIRIFEAGRCELDGAKLLYVVEEYAEENLSQILPERALTAEETRGMLPPILRALQYVHDKGFVHGRIQPSNILAIGDQVKLSSDTLGDATAKSAYDPPEAELSTAGDVWQLGMTLVKVLTQHLPLWDRARPGSPEIAGGVAEPFREIAEGCLQVDAAKRWTVAQIGDCLEGKRPVPTLAQSTTTAASSISVQPKHSAKWPYLLGLVAIVAIAFFLIARPKASSPTAEVQSTEAQPSTTSENAKPAPTSTQTGGDEKTPANADESGAIRRVVPQVSPSARRTLHGTIKVRVKVDVDTAGNVAKAKLESAGPSKYFSRIAIEAAREWTFVPAPAGESGTREWKLQFAFSRAKTEASAVRARR